MKLINLAYQIMKKRIQIILLNKDIFKKEKFKSIKLFELKKLKLKSFNLVTFLGM